MITVEKGDCVEIANRLLTEDIEIGLTSDISKTINKSNNASNGPRVIESSLRIGDPVINVVARIVYRSFRRIISYYSRDKEDAKYRARGMV